MMRIVSVRFEMHASAPMLSSFEELFPSAFLLVYCLDPFHLTLHNGAYERQSEVSALSDGFGISRAGHMQKDNTLLFLRLCEVREGRKVDEVTEKAAGVLADAQIRVGLVLCVSLLALSRYLSPA